MRIKGISIEQLTDCIKALNKERKYKITYNRYPERKGNFIHFTIRSEKSGIPGSRLSYSGRRLVSASWHAHGYLFDKIYDINPNAIIVCGRTRYECKSDNWKDYDVGSLFYPCQFSELSIL